MKQLFFITTLSFVLMFLTSCDLLLGPMKYASFAQRLSNGWSSSEILSISDPISGSINNKLKLVALKGVYTAVFYEQNGVLLYLSTVNENKTANIITNANATTITLRNSFDIYTDGTNLSIIYMLTASQLSRYLGNNTGNNFGGTSYDSFYFIHNGFDSVFGTYNAATIYYIRYSQMTSLDTYSQLFTTNMAVGSYSNLDSCNGRYLNHTIFYSTINSTGSEFCQFYDASAYAPLTSAMFFKPQGAPVAMVADGSSNLYLISQYTIYKYSSSTQTFQKETDINQKLLTPLNGFVSAVIANNIIYILAVDNSVISKVNVITYDMVNKSYTINDLGFKASTIIGADISYDAASSRIGVCIMTKSSTLTKVTLYTVKF